jgi:hypothetical protein
VRSRRRSAAWAEAFRRSDRGQRGEDRHTGGHNAASSAPACDRGACRSSVGSCRPRRAGTRMCGCQSVNDVLCQQPTSAAGRSRSPWGPWGVVHRRCPDTVGVQPAESLGGKFGLKSNGEPLGGFLKGSPKRNVYCFLHINTYEKLQSISQMPKRTLSNVAFLPPLTPLVRL